MLNRVQPPAPRHRVARLGHADALIKRSGVSGKGKVADHPAISEVVVENESVAIIETTARRRGAHGGEERIVGGPVGAIERGAGLVENLDAGVNRLDVMVRPDVAVRIRWETGATALRGGDAAKRGDRRGHRKGLGVLPDFLDRVRRLVGWDPRKRIPRQALRLLFFVRRKVRESVQIHVQGNRSHHLHHIGRTACRRGGDHARLLSGRLAIGGNAEAAYREERSSKQQKEPDENAGIEKGRLRL